MKPRTFSNVWLCVSSKICGKKSVSHSFPIHLCSFHMFWWIWQNSNPELFQEGQHIGVGMIENYWKGQRGRSKTKCNEDRQESTAKNINQIRRRYPTNYNEDLQPYTMEIFNQIQWASNSLYSIHHCSTAGESAVHLNSRLSQLFSFQSAGHLLDLSSNNCML